MEVSKAANSDHSSLSFHTVSLFLPILGTLADWRTGWADFADWDGLGRPGLARTLAIHDRPAWLAQLPYSNIRWAGQAWQSPRDIETFFY